MMANAFDRREKRLIRNGLIEIIDIKVDMYKTKDVLPDL